MNVIFGCAILALSSALSSALSDGKSEPSHASLTPNVVVTPLSQMEVIGIMASIPDFKPGRILHRSHFLGSWIAIPGWGYVRVAAIELDPDKNSLNGITYLSGLTANGAWLEYGQATGKTSDFPVGTQEVDSPCLGNIKTSAIKLIVTHYGEVLTSEYAGVDANGFRIGKKYPDSISEQRTGLFKSAMATLRSRILGSSAAVSPLLLASAAAPGACSRPDKDDYCQPDSTCTTSHSGECYVDSNRDCHCSGEDGGDEERGCYVIINLICEPNYQCLTDGYECTFAPAESGNDDSQPPCRCASK